MKTPIAVLALLALVAVSGVAQNDFHTYVSNKSSQTIVATTSYADGNSAFINRVIPPGTFQGDEYTDAVSGVHVELWVQGAGQHNNVVVNPDRSVVGYDHGDGTTGVDIYEAKYGTLTQIDGPLLVTIYDN